MEKMPIEKPFISSSSKLFTQKFVKNFNEFAFKQNEKNNNTIFPSFKRSFITNLFKKIFHTRTNSKLKPFILTFEL